MAVRLSQAARRPTQTSRTLRLALRVAVLVVGIAFASVPGTAAAAGPNEAGSFGIGLGSGTWTSGLSARYNLTKGTAIQGNLGSYGRYDVSTVGFALSADYLAYRDTLKKTGPVTIGYNLGVGVGLGAFSNVTWIRAAGVAGLEFNFNKFPLDIVLEFRPNISVVPNVGLSLVHLTGQVRYYL